MTIASSSSSPPTVPENADENHHAENFEQQPHHKVRRRKLIKPVVKEDGNSQHGDLMELFLSFLNSDPGARTRHDSITMNQILQQLGWVEMDSWTPKAVDMFFKLANYSKLQSEQRIDIAKSSDKDLWMLVLKGSIDIFHDNQITTLSSCQALNCFKDFDIGTYFEHFEWIAASSEQDAEVLLLDKESVHDIMNTKNKIKSLRQSKRMSYQFQMHGDDSMTKVRDLNPSSFVSNLLWVRLQEVNYFVDFILGLKYVLDEPEKVFEQFTEWMDKKKESVLYKSFDTLVFLFYTWLNICPSDLDRFNGNLLTSINDLCMRLYTMKTEEMMFKINPIVIGSLLQSYVASYKSPDAFEVSLPASSLFFNYKELQWVELNRENSELRPVIFITYVNPDGHLWNQGIRIGHELFAIDYLPLDTFLSNDVNFESFLKDSGKSVMTFHFIIDLNKLFRIPASSAIDELKNVITVNDFLKTNLFKVSSIRKAIEANSHDKHFDSNNFTTTCIFEENAVPIIINQTVYYFLNYNNTLTKEKLDNSIQRHIVKQTKENIENAPFNIVVRDEVKKGLILKEKQLSPSSVFSDLYSEEISETHKITNHFTNPIVIAKDSTVNSKFKSFLVNMFLNQSSELNDLNSNLKFFDLHLLDMKYLAAKLAVYHFNLFRKISTCDIILDVVKNSSYKHDEHYSNYIEAQDTLSQWVKILLAPRTSSKFITRTLRLMLKLLKNLYMIAAMNPFYVILTAIIECKNEYIMVNNSIKSNFKKAFESLKEKINPTSNYKEYQNFLALRKANKPFIPFHLCHLNNFRRYFEKYKLTNSKDDENLMIHFQVITKLGEGISELTLYQKISYNYKECIEKLIVDTSKKGLKDIFRIQEKQSEHISIYEMWKAKVYVEEHMQACTTCDTSELQQDTGKFNTLDSSGSYISTLGSLSNDSGMLSVNDFKKPAGNLEKSSSIIVVAEDKESE